MKKGFTLVEIMIVVAVIALLASILIPNLQRVQVQAQNAAVVKTMSTMADAFEMYQLDNGVYPSNMSSLFDAIPPYLSSNIFEVQTHVVGTSTFYYSYVKDTPYAGGCQFNFLQASYHCRYRPFDGASPLGSAGNLLGYSYFEVTSGKDFRSSLLQF